MKILVAYYSRTGHTRWLAERLAERLGATLCPITEPRKGSGLLWYCKAALDALLGREAAIDAAPVDPAQFDLILVGTPVWCWHLSPPVRSFARRYRASGRRFAFFCTMGGSGAQRAFADLERCLGRSPQAALALTERQLDTPAAESGIQAFISQLRARGLPIVPLETSGVVQGRAA